MPAGSGAIPRHSLQNVLYVGDRWKSIDVEAHHCHTVCAEDKATDCQATYCGPGYVVMCEVDMEFK